MSCLLIQKTQYCPDNNNSNNNNNNSMELQEGKKHILAVAYPAYGHTTPLLELCRKLSRYHHVTFAVSRFTADRMRQREFTALGEDEPVVLFPIDDGVASDATVNVEEWEAAHDMAVKHILPGAQNLMVEVAALTQNGQDNGLHRPVDVVIFDMFLAPPIMAERVPGVLYYYFNTPPAYFLRYLLLLKDVTETIPFEEQDFFQDLPPAGEPLGPQSQMLLDEMGVLGKYLPEVDGVVCNSYRAVDREDIAVLEEKGEIKGKIYCVGPFIPPVNNTTGSETDAAIFRWLDTQKPHSVLYISFGSMAVPTEPQLQEIARALLDLGVAFIWSLRKGHEEKLPTEMREQMANATEEQRHFWIVPWAPQKAILSHRATGAYLSHCGWNSALESMSAGVPVLSWPLFADQRSIGQLLVKRGAALMLSNTDMFFRHIVPAEEIRTAIGTLLIEPAYRDNMQDIRQEIADALADDGSSTRELKEFVQFNV
ncbi:uncharacterized protein LOC129600689 [Paramacrobiotus metropolitanus]|uniref:uncharacterized protein LOC129600689 n=1 Tax=Paramacrobiotus metropolitanus TaxID=2943436 RepID=UPI002446417C|nr:uncharacterized protein LOC129600689 [Paramacrobiotus metropolitanus]